MAVLMKINNTLQSVGALRKVSNALNRTNIELYKKEGISDLTGTSWEITSIACEAGYGQFDIQGEIADSDVSTIDFIWIGYAISFDPMSPTPYIQVVDSIACNQYPTYLAVGNIITITGGNDAINTDLIDWITTHATQITQ